MKMFIAAPARKTPAMPRRRRNADRDAARSTRCSRQTSTAAMRFVSYHDSKKLRDEQHEQLEDEAQDRDLKDKAESPGRIAGKSAEEISLRTGSREGWQNHTPICMHTSDRKVLENAPAPRREP